MFNKNSDEDVKIRKSDLIELVNYCLRKSPETKAQVPEHLNMKQLSRYLNYSEAAIYRLVSQAAIPVYKISGKLLFNKIEIDEWLFEFKQPTIKSQISDLENRCK